MATPGGRTTTRAARQRVDPGAVYGVDTSRPLLALTFDDGPDPQYTPHVLDTLARFGVPATFFVIGRNAVAHPALVDRILAEGHEVANHTRDHLWLNTLSEADVDAQIRGGARDLAAVGVAKTSWFRPPRGWTSPQVVSATYAQHLRSVFWTDCVEAHQGRGRDEALSSLLGEARPGSIILAHDGGTLAGPNPQRIDRSRSVELLPGLLAGLADRGLTACTISTLVAGDGRG